MLRLSHMVACSEGGFVRSKLSVLARNRVDLRYSSFSLTPSLKYLTRARSPKYAALQTTRMEVLELHM